MQTKNLILVILIVVMTLSQISCKVRLLPVARSSVKNIKWDQNYLTELDDQEHIKICPDTDAKKARYECFVYTIHQVKRDLQLDDWHSLLGMFVPSQCIKSKTQVYIPSNNVQSPNGGFNFIDFQCYVLAKN